MFSAPVWVAPFSVENIDHGCMMIPSQRAPSVNEQPIVRLREWRVISASDGNLFLLGLRFQHEQVRVTTEIQAIDYVQRLFVTASGRRYQCDESPGDSLTTAHILISAVHAALPMPLSDVTYAVWAEMQRKLN